MAVLPKRRRLKSPYRWTNNEAKALLNAILDKLAQDPDCFERPLIEKFYNGLKKNNNLLANIDYRIMKSKMRNLKTLYKTAIDYKKSCNYQNSTFNDTEDCFSEYVARACPFFSKLDRIFGDAEKNYKTEGKEEKISSECNSIKNQYAVDKLANNWKQHPDDDFLISDNENLLETLEVTSPEKYFLNFRKNPENFINARKCNALSEIMSMHFKRIEYREKIYSEKLEMQEKKWKEELKLEKEKLKVRKQEIDSNKKIALMKLELEMRDKKFRLQIEEKRLQMALEEQQFRLEMDERLKKYELKLKHQYRK